MRNDFAVFICTHGRPDNQLTLRTLLNSGYTGRWYLVVDDTDATIQSYIDNYGSEHILVFNKNHYINSVDVGTNSPPYACILYAKNAVEDMAIKFALSSFLVCDDDIYNLRYRYADQDKLKSLSLTCNIDDVITSYIDFILTANLTAVSFSGATVFFGGKLVFENVDKWRIPFTMVFRNCAFACTWRSSFSEDIITGLQLAKSGNMCYSLPFVQFSTVAVGGGVGGMQTTYKSMSDVKRAFYSVMYEPSCAKIGNIRNKYLPTYYKNNAFPKLVSHTYKKEK